VEAESPLDEEKSGKNWGVNRGNDLKKTKQELGGREVPSSWNLPEPERLFRGMRGGRPELGDEDRLSKEGKRSKGGRGEFILRFRNQRASVPPSQGENTKMRDGIRRGVPVNLLMKKELRCVHKNSRNSFV